jgi:hypothetical protein
MTQSSKPRKARRVAKKTGTQAPAAPAELAAGGNGQSAPVVGAAPAPKEKGKKVGTMKASDQTKLRDTENAILTKLAEVGDIAIQIEQARSRQGVLAGEVARVREDFKSMMRGVVIANGNDPDTGKFHLDVKDGAIRQVT